MLEHLDTHTHTDEDNIFVFNDKSTTTVKPDLNSSNDVAALCLHTKTHLTVKSINYNNVWK